MRLQTLVATPRDRNGAPVTVRLAGGGDGIAYRFDGQDYWAGLSPHLRFSAATGFDHNGPTGKTSPAVARLVVMPSTPARLKTLAGYHWTGAPVAIAQRVGGVATLELTGRIRSATVDGAALTLTIQDLGETLERPVLTGRFTGTGGAEGSADAEGRLKRWSFGEVHGVEALLFDKAWNIYEVGDTSRPLADVFAPRDKGREGGRQIVAWAGSFDATLAALKAATPPASGGLVAPSIALLRWWTRPVGPLTVSVRGIAAGYREDVAGIAGQLLAQAGGPAIANLAAIAPTRTGVAGLHLDSDSETAAAALDRLLGGAWMGWTLDPVTGQILLRGFERPAGPLPRVRSHSAKRTAQLPPVRARRLGYRRNHRPHAAGDIAAALGAGDVLFDNGMTLDAFRGEIVGRLDAIVSDAVLSRSEKAQAILDWSGLAAQFSALDARFVALGNPADVAAAKASATDAVQQLGAYLTSLAPAWTDTSVDTAIAPATYRERWSTALSAVAGFSAAITGRPGAGAFTLSGDSGTDLDIGPNHVVKRRGGTGWLRTSVFRVAEVFTAGCGLSFRADGGNLAFGLWNRTTPDGSVPPKTLADFSWYVGPSGSVEAFAGAGLLGAHGQVAGQRLGLVYDDRYVVWTIDGEITHRVEVGPGGGFYARGIMRTEGASVSEISWAKAGAIGADGKSAPLVKTQWSIDGQGGWHDHFFGGDMFQRQSNDGGLTWGAGAKVVGEDGTNGRDPSNVFRWSRTVPATPARNSGNPPADWTDGPGGRPDGEGWFLWQTNAVFLDGVQTSDWTAPARISGDDGVSLETDTPVFVIPCLSSGAPKPSWTGGSGRVSLRRGGALLTAGVTYAIAAIDDVTNPTVDANGVYRFAGVTGEIGAFAVRATYQGHAHDCIVSVKKVLDGVGAFRASVALPPGAAETTVPGNSRITMSANVDYEPSGEGNCRLKILLYIRNVTDGGAWTFIGESDFGPYATRTRRGNDAEGIPIFETVPGSIGIARAFDTPAQDKVFAYQATLAVEKTGSAEIAFGGIVQLELTRS